jgi:hypothetical protein
MEMLRKQSTGIDLVIEKRGNVEYGESERED